MKHARCNNAADEEPLARAPTRQRLLLASVAAAAAARTHARVTEDDRRRTERRQDRWRQISTCMGDRAEYQ
jgi:hypothetical protein